MAKGRRLVVEWVADAMDAQVNWAFAMGG